MPGSGVSQPSESVLTVRAMLAVLVKTRSRRALVGLVLVFPLVLAFAGGFGTAEPRELPQLERGEPIEAGIYTLRVDSYFVAEHVHRAELPEGADAWLGLVVAGVNPNADMVRFHRQVIALPEGLVVGAETESHPHPEYVRRLDDGSSDERYPPGLPTSLVALWPVVEQDAPPELELVFQSLEREWSDVLGGYTWYERGPIGRQAVPRDDMLPRVLVEEDQ